MHVKKQRRVTRTLSRAALQAADGLFSYSVDLVLWLSVYLGESMQPYVRNKAWRAASEADRFLQRINYDVLKNALITAKKNGWIKKSRRHANPQITRAGQERLWRAVPVYDEKRAWDGRMHVVTYDIPEAKRKDRDMLREYLRKIGCALLQESLWITPYNPVDILRTFVEEKGLRGTVLISDMGKDGAIGEEDMHHLIARVYGLEKLQERYENLLEDIEDHGVDHWVVIRYLSVLRDDPQLPFALLPRQWAGETVYKKVKHELRKLSINPRPRER